MKEWSALLAAELGSWPSVTSRRMFGMTVFYRDKVIFAALPRTRSFETPQSVAFKLHRKTAQTRKKLEADPRIRGPVQDEGKWIAFELDNEKDLGDALKWFEFAYRAIISDNNSKT